MNRRSHATGKVIVVDDDSAVRQSLAAMFKAAGLNCESYQDGQSLLDTYRSEGTACFVLDVRMPGMSGIQLVEVLKQRRINHPVVMLSDFIDTATTIQAFRLGIADFFEKPPAGSLLIDRVQRCLEEDRIRMERDRLVSQLRHDLDLLSGRETQVMWRLVRGIANKRIAYELEVSEKTIAAHRANLLGKLKVDTLAELIAMLVGAGLYDPVRSRLEDQLEATITLAG